jgi:hypothetical protein
VEGTTAGQVTMVARVMVARATTAAPMIQVQTMVAILGR